MARSPVSRSFTLRLCLLALLFLSLGATTSLASTASAGRDPTLALATDPALALGWHTFLGSNQTDYGYGVTADGNGNIYVTGYSVASWGEPKYGYQSGRDIFVARLDESGGLVWNTFLDGSGSDTGRAITLGGNGHLFVTGDSQNAAGNQDILVAELDTDGNLLGSTYLGGTSDDYGRDIVADGNGYVCVTGFSYASWGAPMNAYSGDLDAVVACLKDGVLEWNTFLGSSSSDFGYGVALDAGGNVYVAGQSFNGWGSNPRRAFGGADDGFVAQLDRNGNLAWHTFLGGGASDLASDVTLNDAGQIFVTGNSKGGWDVPLQPFTSQTDAFVAHLDASGDLNWHTFLGGTGVDEAWSLAAAGRNDLYIAGWSAATWGDPVRAYTAGYDLFIAHLEASSGAFQANTFLGGSGTDMAYGLALGNHLYLVGRSNASWGTPVAVPGYSGADDILVSQLAGFAYRVAATPSDSTIVGSGGGLVPFQVDLINNSSSATTIYAQLEVAHDSAPVNWTTSVRDYQIPADGQITLNLGFTFFATDDAGNYTLTLTAGTDQGNLNLVDSFGLTKSSTVGPASASPQSTARFLDRDSGEVWELQEGPTSVGLQQAAGYQPFAFAFLLFLPLLAALSLILVRARSQQ